MGRPDIFEFNNFRDFMNEIFRRKLVRNPSYSLRAFSRDLGLRPQTMNDVLSHRYGFSHQTALDVATKLGLEGDESEYFVCLVASLHARSAIEKKRALERANALRTDRFAQKNLDEAQYSLFSRWFTPAVLELVDGKPIDADRTEMAQRLGIGELDFDECIRTLLKSGLLQTSSGLFVRAVQHSIANSPTPQAVIRGFHKQILERASMAVDRQNSNQRKSLSSVFMFDSSRFQEAQKDIAKFHANFLRKYSVSESSNSVYGVTVQFFRLDDKS